MSKTLSEKRFINHEFKEAAAGLRRMAKNGNPRGIYCLGEMLVHEFMFTENVKQREEGLRILADGLIVGDPLCLIAYARYDVGLHGQELTSAKRAKLAAKAQEMVKDDNTLPSVIKMAEGGDVLAMTEWAACLLYGTGTEKDAEESLSWLRRAASQDYWLARLRLLQTERLKEDRESRRDVFNQANHLALMGVPDGEFYLGECYEAGWGTEPAWNKAVHHYERAYSLGNPAAAMRLANGYLRDTGNEESEAKAMEWLRLADEKGNGEASYRLGKVYASRGEKEKTWAAVSRACLRNYPAGVFAAGFLQMAGCGTKQDEKQGMIKIRLAAQMGYIPAQMYLKNPENMAERLIHDWNV